MFIELFDATVRYSGVAIGHELASMVAGGFSPIIATALLAWTGASWPVAPLLVEMGVVTAVAVAAAPETRSKDLRADSSAGAVEGAATAASRPS